ncbi:Glutamate receptor ionotropic, NMDA 1 [Dermatophagoides farinae]|uniref:Glutamate [NMDA] receptor subunit 1 n=1 Tax=Dermatophagoides farinae TaxID=6954 RepID=A0A922LC77_DERFA|nr:Glutamate receptor ionotropic, NMDA 1 [Dermatophagoides farinae]
MIIKFFKICLTSNFFQQLSSSLCLVIYLLFLNLDQRKSSTVVDAQRQYHIGAVLSSAEQVVQFQKIIEDINYEGDILPYGVSLHGHSILKQTNPIDDTRNLCHNLMPFEIYAIIIDDTVPSNAITFTSSLHNIPTIGLANRECLFSDKSLYGSYMRTTPTYSNQADVWVRIPIMRLLTHLDFECAHFIVSDSINGRDIKTQFITLADINNLEIESIIEYDFSRPILRPDLEAIKERNSSCRINVLYCLSEIIGLNITGADNIWIVSEQALYAPNLPIGFLGIRYKDQSNIQSHIIDSVYVISNAIKEMRSKINANLTMPPGDCRNIGRSRWTDGDLFYDFLRGQTIIFGKTGKISFDEHGDRLNGHYEIWNQQPNTNPNRTSNNRLVNVGQYYYNQSAMKMTIDIDEKKIVWPGNKTEKPISYSTPAHLRIATLAEIPFVWVLPVNEHKGCSAGQVPCPIRKKNGKTGLYYQETFCCEGYCIDLLIQLAAQLNFTYTLHQVEDGFYGSYRFNDKTGHHEWTGLLGELYYDRADMVVAALTITPERSLAIDFTKPFKYQGITILQKQQAIHRLGHPLTSFLQPFQNSLWVSVFVAVHVVALALYLLDRFSPFGRYKLPNCETITEEDALNLSSAIWFAWGVLFNSGIGEGTPRSFSGRVLGMVWAGFAMIIVASYTANLAAFLVLDRPQTALSGINDPRLRTPPDGFNYSTVRNSAIDNYFKRQVELKLMHQRMSEIFFNNVEDAIAAVKSGTLSAFIWDSARLEYEAANDCELIISGEHFGRSGYAIGLPKDKIYWKDKVSLALLGMHESGFMEDLDQKWILLNEQVCSIRTEHFPPTLGLKNMAGVFILVATGILGGVGLIMFEIFYKQHQTRKQKRMELARNALDRWKEMVQKRKLRKESLRMAAQQRYRDQQVLHRRRQQLRHSSKSLSDERFSTSSSIEITDPHGHQHYLQQQQQSQQSERCNNLYNDKHSDSRHGEFSRPSKPTYLELKHINTSILPSSVAAQQAHPPPTLTTSRRMFEQEQHPVASARIYTKPKLRREFSIAYETSDNTGSAGEDPNFSQRTSSLSSARTTEKYGSNFVNII